MTADPAAVRVDRRDVVVECRQLVRLYRTTSGSVQAVRGIDLEVAGGLITAIRGPSGSGKTTLLRMIAGLDRPSAGTVIVAGVELHELSAGARSAARARLLTHVHQRPGDNLFPHLTAVEQLTRLTRDHDAPAAALEAVGLSSCANRRPWEMSGGERQRLAISRSLVAGHRLVIADEPTSQLDAEATDSTLDALHTLRDRGVAVIVATHDPRVIDRVDEQVLLRDGAVASVTVAGTELAVIDASGRVQLSPEIREAYSDGRAQLTFDPESGRVEMWRP